MEDPIPFTYLNDFLFCPASIYFHNLMGGLDRTSAQSRCQIEGTSAHARIDRGSSDGLMMGMSVYSEQLGLYGSIDMFDPRTGTLTERKNLIRNVYDGFVFQLYAQYYAMTESGYDVRRLRLHSLKDNRNYDIPLPSENPDMDQRFRELIDRMHNYRMSSPHDVNPLKCARCIYEPVCGYSGVQQ